MKRRWVPGAVRQKCGVEMRSPDAVMLELRRACGAEDVPSRVASIENTARTP
jgi:hypothetical protein